MLQPLFEFSGACAGCGETPYLKLLSQLFGDRLVVANATGCSSIYGGNLPTTPWTADAEGRGRPGPTRCSRTTPSSAWACGWPSTSRRAGPRSSWRAWRAEVGEDLAAAHPRRRPDGEAGVAAQRERVAELRRPPGRHRRVRTPGSWRRLADELVRASVWIVGGDGWAYDIGFGGLDHVLASGRDVNMLVLDTEVYSNTGGQASKATPRGAVAKFAAGGKATARRTWA